MFSFIRRLQLQHRLKTKDQRLKTKDQRLKPKAHHYISIKLINANASFQEK